MSSSPPTTPASARPESTSTTLPHGRALLIARVVWCALVALALGVTLSGVPASLAIALSIGPETRAGLIGLGLSPDAPAFYLIGLDLIMVVAFTAIGLLMAWRRWNDWMVLFVALMLILTAVLYTAPLYEAPVPMPIIATICALAEICQAFFVFLFPNGRFVPRWTWLLLVPLFVWRPAIWGLVYLPDYLSMARDGDQYGYLPQDSLDIGLFALLLVIGIITQVYRFRRVSNAVQRQQTKWLLLGVVAAVAVVTTYTIAVHTLGALQQAGHEALLLRMAGRTVRQLALILAPLALAYSILRYRLWDIDILINRTLVYTLLTGLLVAVYLGSVVLLQSGFRALTGQESELAVIVSTLAIAALFQPLRGRVQTFIDRRFYRARYDATQTLAAFSARLRDEVELPALTADLVAVVERTMRPESISLWVRAGNDTGVRRNA